MHDSRTVANRFLALAKSRGDTLTPMQLLKLVYIAHGWMLGLAGRPLIRDQVQAWQYGPVIPPLYDALRHYRRDAVTQSLAQPIGDALDPQEEHMVGEVDRIYGRLSGGQLSNLTHAKETPWALTYRKGEFGIPIPDDIIKAHYKRLAEQRG
ncbi:MAG TPA: type II toxin-antitoxin system antitoxin SocA domain-containing protein [Caulobacteraceae bacterium]|nr:type II toxin-antitoxin system antitoxin SocA domain-containing protein [Caulobacteraceae bacterium]